MTRHVVVSTAFAVAALASPALADGPVVDRGFVTGAGSGLGHTVYALLQPNNTYLLRDATDDAPPVTLHLPPIAQLMRSITVGDGPSDGDATAVIETCATTATCRRTVRIAYDLKTGRARNLRLPAPPSGCFDGGALYEGRHLYVLREGRARCRPGIYQLHRGRLVRRLAATDVTAFDVDGGRLALWYSTSDRRGLISKVVVGRFRGSHRRVVWSDRSQGNDCELGLGIDLSGRRLTLGAVRLCEDSGQSAFARRFELGGRLRCSTIRVPHAEAQQLGDWTFPSPRVLLYERRVTGTDIELVRWTSSRFVRGSCSGGFD